MLETTDFHILQLRFIKRAMDDFAPYRPDGKTPAQVATMITTAKTVRTTYMDAKTTLDLALGNYHTAIAAGHGICVQVYPIMKSRFRLDSASLEAINKLPTDDQSPAATIKRLELIISLWTRLPNPPDSLTPFKAWDTLGLTEFTAYLTTIGTKTELKDDADEQFEVEEGNLHKSDKTLDDFITAALIQGRGQFLDGTVEREVIDAIPTAPAQQLPGKTIISEATSPAASAAHLVYDAPHGTSFDVFRQGPGDPGFILVAEDTIDKTYDASGLVVGNHDFKVVARNSKGTGPASDVSVVNVA